MAKQVNGLHASTKHNIAITPFGINTSTFKSHRRIFSNEIITIGIVKTLEHRYGIDLLLNAFAQVKAILKKNNSKKVIKLVVVGGGHLESELKKLALKLNIEADVDFVGRVDNSLVVDYINKMDIFVVPSRIESFGVAAVEALACERPCIVANTGGLPEVIIDGETGLVVEAESANAIALSIVYLINNPDKAIEMGISGRLDVIHKYDEFHTVQKMIELYKTFISKNSH
jgi:glycosyltransferase involved in cell wall biosynthesis